MFVKILSEFLGTFFFLSVILATGEAIPIAIALGAAIFLRRCAHCDELDFRLGDGFRCV